MYSSNVQARLRDPHHVASHVGVTVGSDSSFRREQKKVHSSGMGWSSVQAMTDKAGHQARHLTSLQRTPTSTHRRHLRCQRSRRRGRAQWRCLWTEGCVTVLRRDVLRDVQKETPLQMARKHDTYLHRAGGGSDTIHTSRILKHSNIPIVIAVYPRPLSTQKPIPSSAR